MAEELMKTCNLSAKYNDFQALFDVSIKINVGEIISIIGANGAGKTTLMRSITGLLSQEPSMVEYRGKSIGHLRADEIVKMGIAMVPEGRQLFASLNVEENIIIGAQANRKGPWSLKKIYDVFPILEERKYVPSTQISGGQQQMVAIGRALMSNPDLLLFDEISLGLAPIIIESIYKLLPTLIGDDLSVIIVEQDVTKALAVSDRVYCMQEGRISLEGQSNELGKKEILNAYFGT